MYPKQIILFCALVTVMSGYAFDSSEAQFKFRDPSPEEIQRLGAAEEQLNALEKRVNVIALHVQTVNNRFDTIERISKFFIFPLAVSTIAAVGAFHAIEWYNKSYQKKLNKYLIAATAGLSTATIIYFAVLSAAK